MTVDQKDTFDTETTESTPESIAYLAYGSNLASKTFRGRRGIKPLESHPVFVPTLNLEFDLPGVPYLEPCFANVSVHPDVKYTPELEKNFNPVLTGANLADRPHGLYGVVYMVTPADYAKIIMTEGGGASYKDELVVCYPLDENFAPIEAHTLHAGPPSTRVIDPPQECSPRYLNLLVDGSKEHNLPDKWVGYLSSLPSYRATTVGQKIGKYVLITTWLPSFIAIHLGSLLLRDKEGRMPSWMQSLFRGYSKAMWTYYDVFLKKLCGDGERSGGHGLEKMGKWERKEVEQLEEIAEEL